jgi:hypothetical protein
VTLSRAVSTRSQWEPDSAEPRQSSDPLECLFLARGATLERYLSPGSHFQALAAGRIGRSPGGAVRDGLATVYSCSSRA